jgi:ATP-dependent Clp protease ATP-binding subunit ClpX
MNDLEKQFNKQFNPRAIKAYLDRFVKGQETAKKRLSIAGYKHMLRIRARALAVQAQSKSEAQEALKHLESEIRLTQGIIPKIREEIERLTKKYEVDQNSALKAKLISGHQSLHTNEKKLEKLTKTKAELNRKLKGFEGITSVVTPVKNNVVLIGPSGVGKTYLFQKLAEYLNLPYAIADMSSTTKSGYVGSCVSDFVKRIVTTPENKGLTQFAIVLLDELDKIAPDKTAAHTDEVGTIGVQFEVLKVIEGTQVEVNRDDLIDTKDMLFIGAGAFGGQVKEGKTKTEVEKSMGFGGETKETTKVIPLNDQLVEYGLIPELVGRFQTGACLDQLTPTDLVDIMTSTEESALKNAIQLFKSQGIKLSFSKDALTLIAEIAIKKGTGARAINSMLELVLTDCQYALLGAGVSRRIRITTKQIEQVSL